LPKEESWKALLSQQREITEALDKEIKSFKSEAIVVENEALRKELSQYKEQLTTANQQLSALSDENTKLKNSLYEQIYNEKIAILNSVTKKTDVYYISSMNGELLY
jgi:predicted nuclease with TOPRIM domain